MTLGATGPWAGLEAGTRNSYFLSPVQVLLLSTPASCLCILQCAMATVSRGSHSLRPCVLAFCNCHRHSLREQLRKLFMCATSTQDSRSGSDSGSEEMKKTQITQTDTQTDKQESVYCELRRGKLSCPPRAQRVGSGEVKRVAG